MLKPAQPLSLEDWKSLESLQVDLDKEYALRCQMLLTRLDVTIQSFEWNCSKDAIASLMSRYTEKRKELDDLVDVHKETDIVDLLAARSDLLIIQKTSSELVRRNTQSKIQKHIIGKVPDRGGLFRKFAVYANKIAQFIYYLWWIYRTCQRTSNSSTRNAPVAKE